MNHLVYNLKPRPPFLTHVVLRETEPSCHASVNLFVDLCADYTLGDSEIEIGLESEPKLGRNTEVFAQSQRGVGSDSAFPVHNSADAAGWNGDFPRESIDTDVIGFMNSSKRISPGWIGASSFLCAISPRYDSRYEKFSSMVSPGRSALTASTTCAS